MAYDIDTKCIHVEKIVANLEGGVDAIAFSSGMAAIDVVMELFSPGDHLIVDDDLYGGTIRWFSHMVSYFYHYVVDRNACWRNHRS